MASQGSRTWLYIVLLVAVVLLQDNSGRAASMPWLYIWIAAWLIGGTLDSWVETFGSFQQLPKRLCQGRPKDCGISTFVGVDSLWPGALFGVHQGHGMVLWTKTTKPWPQQNCGWKGKPEPLSHCQDVVDVFFRLLVKELVPVFGSYHIIIIVALCLLPQHQDLLKIISRLVWLCLHWRLGRTPAWPSTTLLLR